MPLCALRGCEPKGVMRRGQSASGLRDWFTEARGEAHACILEAMVFSQGAKAEMPRMEDGSGNRSDGQRRSPSSTP